MDTLPRDDAPGTDDPPYSLPSPLRQEGVGLPVAPSAPRIPRALRAFNGMPPPPAQPAPPEPPPAPSARVRGREAPQRSIRDLLLDAGPPEPEEAGLISGLRAAWRRLRRPAGHGPDDG